MLDASPSFHFGGTFGQPGSTSKVGSARGCKRGPSAAATGPPAATMDAITKTNFQLSRIAIPLQTFSRTNLPRSVIY